MFVHTRIKQINNQYSGFSMIGYTFGQNTVTSRLSREWVPWNPLHGTLWQINKSITKKTAFDQIYNQYHTNNSMTNQYTSYNDHYEQPFNQYNFHVQRFYKQFLNQITTTKYMTNQPYPTAELLLTNCIERMVMALCYHTALKNLDVRLDKAPRSNRTSKTFLSFHLDVRLDLFGPPDSPR